MKSTIAFVLAATALFSASGPQTQAQDQDGIAFFMDGEFDSAARALAPQAQQGSAMAQYLLALLYERGYGVPHDPARAVQLCTAAASKRFPQAWAKLGESYRRGYGIPRDPAKGFQWTTKAALQGDAVGMLDAGVMLVGGDGVAANLVEATAWFILADEAGHPFAGHNLKSTSGKLSVEQSAQARARAEELRQLLAAERDRGGMIQLDIDIKDAEDAAYSKGEQAYVDGNYEKAKQYLVPIASTGHRFAQFYVGRLYQTGRGFEADLVVAARWYTLAARQEAHSAMYNLALMYAAGQGTAGIDNPQQLGVALMVATAWRGHADAMNDLGVILNEGQLVQRDPVEAYAWWLLAGQVDSEAGRSNAAAAQRELNAQEVESGRRRAGEIEQQAKAGRIPPIPHLPLPGGPFAGADEQRTAGPATQVPDATTNDLRPPPAWTGPPQPLPGSVLPRVQPPQPFTELPATQPNVSARTIYVQDHGDDSATANLMRAATQLAGYFDAKPTMTSGSREKDDQFAQAFFEATLQGVPVRGLAVARVNGEACSVAFIYDRADASPTGLTPAIAVLEQRIGPVMPRASRQANGGDLEQQQATVKLTPVNLPDGSRVSLPQDWRIAHAGEGSFDAVGPGGQGLSAGAAFTVSTQPQVNPLTAQPYPGQMVAPFSKPVDALRNVAPQIYRAIRQGGPQAPDLRLTRIIEHVDVQTGQANMFASYILYDLTYNDQPHRALAMVITQPMTSETWSYYTTVVGGPAETFERDLPGMLAAWNSWQVNPAVHRARFNRAMANMRDIHRMLKSSRDYGARVSEDAHLDFIEVVRGDRIVRDTELGYDHWVDLHHSKDIVENLNKAEGWNRYEEIPFREWYWGR